MLRSIRVPASARKTSQPHCAQSQWAGAGAQVRKDEKAAFAVFYKELEIAAETGKAETEND
jgi:hypothetical protein